LNLLKAQAECSVIVLRLDRLMPNEWLAISAFGRPTPEWDLARYLNNGSSCAMFNADDRVRRKAELTGNGSGGTLELQPIQAAGAREQAECSSTQVVEVVT
jgi:hypothetical protein